MQASSRGQRPRWQQWRNRWHHRAGNCSWPCHLSQSHHFSNKKNLSNHSVLHFFWVNPRGVKSWISPIWWLFPIHTSIFAELAPLPSQISTFWSWWISCMVFHSALHLIPQAMDAYHGELEKGWKQVGKNRHPHGLKSMKLMHRPTDTQTWQDVSKKWQWWVVNKDGARMLGRCGPGICIDQGTVPLLLHEAVHVYNTTCHVTSKMVHRQS